jgi:hypothetical protein
MSTNCAPLFMTAYGNYISQLIWYAKACSAYDQFLIRSSLLTNKLMLQWFLKSAIWKLTDLVSQFNIPLSKMLFDMFGIINL